MVTGFYLLFLINSAHSDCLILLILKEGYRSDGFEVGLFEEFFLI